MTALSLTERLSRIEDPGDMTLACDGVMLSVHKSVCCSHSPVMAAAMNGNWMARRSLVAKLPRHANVQQESKTNTLIVDFPLDSVLRMIQYMYTGDYTVQLDPGLYQIANCSIDADAITLLRAENRPVQHAALDLHGGVNIVADYYMIPALAMMSTKAAESALAACTFGKYERFFQRSMATNADKVFLTMLAQNAWTNLDRMYHDKIFTEGPFAREIVALVCDTYLDSIPNSRKLRYAYVKLWVDLHEAPNVLLPPPIKDEIFARVIAFDLGVPDEWTEESTAVEETSSDT
ncbi:hypothetical protein F5Y18DRAFT_427529 [Xylariaceae sp. FL1019]|nr:hypothetical protein F5Y18DRAFT_427529 [Xylariaceae sp. FL1019]